MPGAQPDLHAFESLRPSVEVRGASLVSISQQTVAENAKAHAQLKLGFPIPSDRGGRLVVDEVLFRAVVPYSRNLFGRATDLWATKSR
jgi:peroxiredoxin